MLASEHVVQFPAFHLQPDWFDVIVSHQPNENVWLTKKPINCDKGSTYDLTLRNGTFETKDSDIQILKCANRCLEVRDIASKLTNRFTSQVKTFTSIHTKSINALDVAPSGIAVSASNDATMKVWDTCGGIIKCELKGHFLDVNRCRFFPSNEVIVSAGLDMQIKIWSAIDGSCPVTLTGHKGSVNDIAIVDRGRNIISVSRDGLVKLWSCGKERCIEDIYNISEQNNHSINACSITSVNGVDLGRRDCGAVDGDAAGTGDKLLAFATDSGSVYGVGVNSHQKVFQIDCQSPVNTLAFYNHHCLVYGLENGLVYESDVRKPEKPVCCWNYSKSPVLSVLPVQQTRAGSGGDGFRIVIGRQDGTVNILDNFNSAAEVGYLTGSDCDPIYQLVFDGKSIFTACRDGKVRKYFLN